jgi:hypothetical protein
VRLARDCHYADGVIPEGAECALSTAEELAAYEAKYAGMPSPRVNGCVLVRLAGKLRWVHPETDLGFPPGVRPT